MDRLLKLGITVTASLFASGCTLAEFSSINRTFNPSMGDSRLIDAKQRAIISIIPQNRDARAPIVCAEPSPDAIQATAAALEGSGALEKPGAGAASLQAAAGFSEGVASIGLRTQSIQLLRDSYYRNCEGFANGALDDVAFNIMHQRFQNHTVALLAIEQLTGAAIAPAAAAAASAGGEASAPEITVTAATDNSGGGAEDRGEGAGQTDGGDTTISGAPEGSVTTTATATIGSTAAASAQIPEHVSLAIAAIAQDALNQDYSLQLCLEFAREVFTKKEAVETALSRLGADPGKNIGQSIEGLLSAQMALDYCTSRLTQDAERQRAMNRLISAKADIVDSVAAGIRARGSNHVSDKHALEIIEAINVTLPNDTRTSFALRTPRITAGGLTVQSADPCPDGFKLDRASQKCVAG